MKKNINGFTLVEVIVATTIMTIAVFGVFKLITENSKIITNSNNLLQAKYLYQPITECLENKNISYIDSLPGNKYFMNFGNNNTDCNIVTDSNYVVIDNIEYLLEIEKQSFIDGVMTLMIKIQSDGISDIHYEYILE